MTYGSSIDLGRAMGRRVVDGGRQYLGTDELRQGGVSWLAKASYSQGSGNTQRLDCDKDARAYQQWYQGQFKELNGDYCPTRMQAGCYNLPSYHDWAKQCGTQRQYQEFADRDGQATGGRSRFELAAAAQRERELALYYERFYPDGQLQERGMGYYRDKETAALYGRFEQEA